MFSPIVLFVCGTIFLYFVLDNARSDTAEWTPSG